MSEVTVGLRLRGSRKFGQDAARARRDIAGFGAAGKTANRGLMAAGGRFNKFHNTLRRGSRITQGYGRSMLGLGAGFAAFRGVQNAVDDTQTFSLGVARLNEQFGFGAKEASRWMGVFTTRDIDINKVNMSMKSLATTLDSARGGSKTAAKVFKDLGVPLDELDAKDPSGTILRLSDAFSEMPKGIDRARIAQKLFGRQGAAMLPLLAGGSKGLREQLNLADKYGVTVGGKAVQSAKDLKAAQREQKLASLGLSLTMGRFLIPKITSAIKWTNKFFVDMRKGKGTAGDLADIVKTLASWVGKLAKWFTGLPKPVRTVLLIMGGLVLLLPQAVTLIGALITAIEGVAAAVMFLAANPIVLAIAAVVALFVVLYLKVKWFHNAVDAVVRFFLKHWPLLGMVLGPFGVMLLLVIRHFNGIKRAAINAWNGIKGAFSGAVGFFKGLGEGIANFIKAPINAVIGLWNDFHLSFGGKKVLGHTVIPGFDMKLPHIQPLAAGGIVTSRMQLVGEHGPELLSAPIGSRVTPTGSLPRRGGGEMVAKVYLDKRQIAQAIATENADRAARR